MRNPLTWVIHRLLRLYAIRNNVRVGQNVHIGVGSILWAPHLLQLDDDVYVGKFVTIQCNGLIGRGTMIANNVGIVGRLDHDFRQVGRRIREASWVGDPDYRHSPELARIVIGEDVWIGFGSVLLTGTNVGRGAVVAAGSVVTKSVEPYTIVAGNPARPIGVRFTDDQIRKHEEILADADVN